MGINNGELQVSYCKYSYRSDANNSDEPVMNLINFNFWHKKNNVSMI